MTTEDLFELLLKRLDRQDLMNDSLHQMIKQMDGKLTVHINEGEELRVTIEEMSDMWKRSKVVSWFITKVATFVAVGTAIVTWARDHIR